MLRGECHRDKFKFDHTHPEDFLKCFWQNRPSVLLIWVVYRVMLVTYFLTIFPWVLVHKARPDDPDWYTNLVFASTWNFFLQLVVFGLASGITLQRYLQEKKLDEDSEIPPMQEMPWHYKILWFLYNMAAACACIICLMFWIFMYSPESNTEGLSFLIASRVFNMVFVLLDFMLYAIPYRFLHFYVPCVLGACHFLFTYFYYLAEGGSSTNKHLKIPPLDWGNPGHSIVSYIVATMLIIISHIGLCTINLLKLWMKKRREGGLENQSSFITAL